MKRLVTALVAAMIGACLSGCSAPGALTDAQRRHLSSQPVLYVVNYVARQPFTIRADDQARARFVSGVVPGREASRPSSAPLARSRPSVWPDDPAVHIKESLAAALRSELGVARTESLQLGRSDEGVDALRKRFTSGMLLDALTLRWGLDDGHVAYTARVRIIDLDAGKILWIGACEWKPGGHVDRAIGTDDLLADDAHVLRSAVGHAAESCARSLRASMLAAARSEGQGPEHAPD